MLNDVQSVCLGPKLECFSSKVSVGLLEWIGNSPTSKLGPRTLANEDILVKETAAITETFPNLLFVTH